MNERTEYDALATMLAGLERRIDKHDVHIDSLVEKTVATAVSQMQSSLLTEDERMWVKLALQAQAQRVRLRQSIIDKSITALLIGLGGWVVVVFLEYFRSHGWK